jgi:hypothetical protein
MIFSVVFQSDSFIHFRQLWLFASLSLSLFFSVSLWFSMFPREHYGHWKWQHPPQLLDCVAGLSFYSQSLFIMVDGARALLSLNALLKYAFILLFYMRLFDICMFVFVFVCVCLRLVSHCVVLHFCCCSLSLLNILSLL